jgi:hypothetical protein
MKAEKFAGSVDTPMIYECEKFAKAFWRDILPHIAMPPETEMVVTDAEDWFFVGPDGRLYLSYEVEIDNGSQPPSTLRLVDMSAPIYDPADDVNDQIGNLAGKLESSKTIAFRRLCQEGLIISEEFEKIHGVRLMTSRIRIGTDAGKLEGFAWPGGYPLAYITTGDDVVCPKCANAIEEKDEDELPRTAFVNWEDDELFCAACQEKIPSAYATQDDGEKPTVRLAFKTIADAIKATERMVVDHEDILRGYEEPIRYERGCTVIALYVALDDAKKLIPRDCYDCVNADAVKVALEMDEVRR